MSKNYQGMVSIGRGTLAQRVPAIALRVITKFKQEHRRNITGDAFYRTGINRAPDDGTRANIHSPSNSSGGGLGF